MKFLGYTVAPYWHAEMIFAIPFGIWFVWRVETIVHLLTVISSCHL